MILPAVEGAPATEPAELLEGADGLLLIGGGDLDPAHYGQPVHPRSYGFNPIRDAMELDLARHALDGDIPVLAICRGCQVVNVARGGTLFQHISDEPGYADDLHGRPHDLEFGHHPVDVEPGSRLAEAVGRTRIADCLSAHHQSVDLVGEGLCVTGRSEDGCVEALELEGGERFAVAVQWHPEMTAEADEDQQKLFDALVEAARRYRQLRLRRMSEATV